MLVEQTQERTPEVKLVSNGPRYSADDLLYSLGAVQSPAVETDVTAMSQRLPANLDSDISAAVDHFQAAEPTLWQGNWQNARDALTGAERFPSQSEADNYLAGEIARFGAARGLIGEVLEAYTEQVFEHSGLALRDKWKNRRDYRKRTVRNACAGLTPKAIASLNSSQCVTPEWQLKGDVRAAKYARDLYCGRLLYVKGIGKWLRWREEDERWQWCDLGEEIRKITKANIQLYQAACSAAKQMEAEAGRRLVAETAQLQTTHRILAVLKLMKSMPGMSMKSDALDSKPELLGVGNGVVDLTTGALMPNRPDLYITKHIEVDFDPAASAPRWDTFLSEVFCNDQATIEAVQRLVGMTITGGTNEEVMIFCIGSGSNGKSIYSNVLYHMLDAYAVTAPSSLLEARRSDDHGPRPDLAMLAGSRLVSINELKKGMTLDETVVKQLAGREPISARFLYQGLFTFQPTFTVWVRSNHKPIIKGTDNGIWRRIAILPFRRTFKKEEEDPRLEAKLIAECQGILAWMVQGAVLYLRDGIKFSPTMMAEVAQYRDDSDILGSFLDERTERGEGFEVSQRVLYTSFGMWCAANGVRCPSKGSFTSQLADRGIRQRKSGADRYYIGLRLRTEG